MISRSIHMVRFHGAAARFVPCMWKGITAGRWMASAAPDWWRKGWPRDRVDSMAEAELLSQLAVALKPRTKIGELFRRFPAPDGWGGKYLDPDLAVHGVLRKKDAALFVEYDGFWRHSEDERLSTDHRKNAALLSTAPPGSQVVRIGHWGRKPLESAPHVLWISVDRWSLGDQKSISKMLTCIFLEILAEVGECLDPSVAKRLQKLARMAYRPALVRSKEFVKEAAVAAGGSSKEELVAMLTSHGFSSWNLAALEETSYFLRLSSERQLKPCLRYLFSLGLSQDEIMKALVRYPRILGLSLEHKLKPMVQWLSELGLTDCQIRRNVTSSPHILDFSIEHNLKPTVQWFLDLGLTKCQVAKAVATNPRIFSFSIDQKLKPTLQWFLDLGMTNGQIAKAVATHPGVLGLGIEQNLKPTVQWFLDLGLTKKDVAKLAATFPQILSLSIEQNLKPTTQWFLDVGLKKSQVAKAAASWPPMLWYSTKQKLKPTVQWLLHLGLTKSQVVKALAARPQIFGLSIEQNLKPTVEWLLDLGLTKSQVAKVVAAYPHFLGLSIKQNLKPTVQWFLDLGLGKSQVAKMVANCPSILGLSMEQNLKPTVDWFLEFDVTKHRLAARISGWPRLLGYSIANNLEPKALLLETLFTQDGAREIIANNPEILRFSHQRMATRLSILSKLGETSKAYYAMNMSDEIFQKRFSSRCSSWLLEWRSSGIVVIHMKLTVADRLLERGVGKISFLHLSLHNEVAMTPLEGCLQPVPPGTCQRTHEDEEVERSLWCSSAKWAEAKWHLNHLNCWKDILEGLECQRFQRLAAGKQIAWAGVRGNCWAHHPSKCVRSNIPVWHSMSVYIYMFWFLLVHGLQKWCSGDFRGLGQLQVIHLQPPNCMLSVSHFPSIPNYCMWPDDGTLMAVQYSFQHHCDSSQGFETRLLLIFSCSASVRAGFETSNQHRSSQSKILQTCFAESILVGLWIYLSII